MRILIVTPLFPPDTAPSAQYTKELARRLSSRHEVTILLYGHLPEYIPNVKLVSVDKRRIAPLRIFSFMRELQTSNWLNDIILIQNGPSVELPAQFTLTYTKTPVIYMESDKLALGRSTKNPTYLNIHRQLRKRANAIYGHQNPWPNTKPIIHPLKPYPEKAFRAWEKSWERHLHQIEALLEKNKKYGENS